MSKDFLTNIFKLVSLIIIGCFVPGTNSLGAPAETYTVILDKNNVNATDGTTSVTAEYDSFLPAITLPTLSVPGVMFGGYYDTSAQTGGTQYYDENGPPSKAWDKTENSTLYARWKKDVTFDYNNGDTDGNGMCYFDDKLTLPATPTRQGYEFRGWILQQ